MGINMSITDLAKKILMDDLEVIAPNFKKVILGDKEVFQIIDKLSTDMEVTKQEALTGIMLLMLKGAASAGTPNTLSVQLKNEKFITKKNLMSAYVAVTGNVYIRRLAETLAIHIGEFAENFNLQGELSQRVNTMLKADTGEILTQKRDYDNSTKHFYRAMKISEETNDGDMKE
jgi:hypothetical protein